MEKIKQNRKVAIIIIIIIAFVWMFVNYSRIGELTRKVTFLDNLTIDLQDKVDYLERKVSKYKIALEEANNNIRVANSIIEDAQYYAWESYDDMGYALENLKTVDTVNEP